MFQARRQLVASWTGVALLCMGVAYGQDVQAPVNSSLPGAILDSTVAPSNTPGGVTPKVIRSGESVIDEESDAGDDENGPTADSQPEKRFYIEKIQLLNNHVLPDRFFNPEIAKYEGRFITFSELKKLALTLSQQYREEGYITSRVVIPPQKIENNTVTLEAKEGTMGEVTIEDGEYFDKRSLKYRLAVNEGEPLNYFKLRNSLLRYNENPDVNGKVLLKRGVKPGTTDAQFVLADQRPVHISPFYDNLGRKSVGTERLGVTAQHNNVFGFGDTNLTSVSFSRDSIGVVTQYRLPIGSRGTTLGFDYAHSRLRVGEPSQLAALDIEGGADTYTASVEQELYRDPATLIKSSLAFDWKTLFTNLQNARFNTDRIRVIRTGISATRFDPWGKTILDQELNFGVDWFDATNGRHTEASRRFAGSKYFAYNANLTRIQKLPWSTFGVARVSAQLTPDRLVSSEQMQLGGAFTVRGYTEGRLIGDKGLNASAEWYIPVRIFPNSWKIPMTDRYLNDSVQAVLFTDFGASYVNYPTPGQDRSEYLLGVGGGLRVNLTRFVSARVDLGIPLLRQFPDSQSPRIHFGLQSNLF